MLPRRSSLSRLLMLGGGLFFCVWLYLAAPSTDTALAHRSSVPSDWSTLSNTPVRELLKKPESKISGEKSKSSKNNEHHVNQTLESLKHNMTMLKANMSGVGAIIRGINQSIDHSHHPNPHPFKYILNTKSICRNQDIFVITYVHTAPDHYKRRMVIRQTWGNPKYYPNLNMRVVFVMGRTEGKPEVQEALAFESEQYHDIVQEDFIDSYKNLTFKGIAALKWIDNHCKHAKFVLKSDDDIFVNTFTLFRHLQSLNQTGVDNKGLMLCLVWYRMKVMREGKWKVEKEEFKEDYYPTYCSGSAFTMTTDVAVALHNISYYVPFFWVDDFYITGLLPLKLGTVKHKQFMSTYVLDGRKLQEKFTGPQWFTYIFSHVHDLNAIQSVWEKLVKLSRGQDRPQVKFALPGQLPNEAEIRRKEKEAEEKKAKEAKQKAEAAKKKSAKKS